MEMDIDIRNRTVDGDTNTDEIENEDEFGVEDRNEDMEI